MVQIFQRESIFWSIISSGGNQFWGVHFYYDRSTVRGIGNALKIRIVYGIFRHNHRYPSQRELGGKFVTSLRAQLALFSVLLPSFAGLFCLFGKYLLQIFACTIFHYIKWSFFVRFDEPCTLVPDYLQSYINLNMQGF